MKNTTKTPASKKFKKAPDLKKEKIPSISRSFTDRNERGSPKGAARNIPESRHWYSILLNKYFLVSFLTTFLGVALALQGISVSKSLSTLRSIEGERSKIEREVRYWEKIISTRPDYRDAYFKLALLEYQLGDSDKTRIYLEKTLEIDPNYTPALDFRKEAGDAYSL